MPDLIIFDLDGTLMDSASGAIFPRSIRDRRWLPGRRDHVIELGRQGIITALATNQGGAAFGIFKPNEMDAYLNEIAREANIRSVKVCYSHPDGRVLELTRDDPRRKPNPGMLVEHLRDWNVQPLDALFIGDREEDRHAAENAGIPFQWANAYFSFTQPDFWLSK